MFKFLFVFPSVMVLVPSFPPPSRFTWVLALQGIFTVSSLLLFFLPPLYPYPRIQPPPSSSVWSFIVRPSEVFNQSAEGRPKSSPGFLYSGPMQVCTPPPPDLCSWWYLAWVWAEGRRRRRPPRWSGVPRRVDR